MQNFTYGSLFLDSGVSAVVVVLVALVVAIVCIGLGFFIGGIFKKKYFEKERGNLDE